MELYTTSSDILESWNKIWNPKVVTNKDGNTNRDFDLDNIHEICRIIEGRYLNIYA
jgi:hypothetical protein